MRAGPQRIVRAARHEGGKVRAALPHGLRRAPVGPLGLGGHLMRALPLEAALGGGDAVHHGLAVAEHEIEPVLAGIHDDVAGRRRRVEVHHLAALEARARGPPRPWRWPRRAR